MLISTNRVKIFAIQENYSRFILVLKVIHLKESQPNFSQIESRRD
jgi:hypothetical protein